ncbi:MAG: hypothetical protein HC854_08430, partial [Flavobacterium sp.]|nr:hypothetical protein [Flavobacterium sp.]
VFYPLLGKSNHEIAALSRSQHKCQGFGSTGSRGNETEYLELLKVIYQIQLIFLKELIPLGIELKVEKLLVKF